MLSRCQLSPAIARLQVPISRPTPHLMKILEEVGSGEGQGSGARGHGAGAVRCRGARLRLRGREGVETGAWAGGGPEQGCVTQGVLEDRAEITRGCF